MSKVEELAAFVVQSEYDKITQEARRDLKIHLLDALGCAIGALEGDPIIRLRKHVDEFSNGGLCSLIGGGRSAPDRATLYNSALVRYLDFNDSYLAPDETCHPSDNLGAILAAVEYAGGDGKDFLTAMAVAYQVQCRLSDEAPVRAKGFDHTTQGSYAVAAGTARALGLDIKQTANALAISGTAFNALRVTRTGALSNWKGLAYPNTAFCGVHATFLAKQGITGPAEVFEGNKGFEETISGPFEIDWANENLEIITSTILKKYNAEIHAQSALEGTWELKRKFKIRPVEIDEIEIDIFEVAYNIIGGGEEGEKITVRTKEEADHSLPYMIAAILLDDQLLPAQYESSRINCQDIQALLRKVKVRPESEYSRRFPAEHACRIKIIMADGCVFEREKNNYEGFHSKPMNWAKVADKFRLLVENFTNEKLRERIIETVDHIEYLEISELMELLSRCGR